MASDNPSVMSASDSSTDNVSIRVVTLAHATTQNEEVRLDLSIDTTVAQLKDRLQETLSQHPRPESQRLIYQGRPLTDGNTTLRQTLRLEASPTNTPPAHVLHLVIRDSQLQIPPSTTPLRHAQPQEQAEAQTQAQAQAGSANASSLPPPTPFPLQQTFGLAPQALQHQHAAMIQNLLQSHMAIHQRNQRQHLQNGIHVPTAQLDQNNSMAPTGQPGSAQPLPPTGPHSHAVGSGSDTPGIRTTSSNNATNVVRNTTTTRVPESTGPYGERVRRVVQNGPLLPPQLNPVERSASAPGSATHPAGPHTPIRPGVPASNLPTQSHFQAPQLNAFPPLHRWPAVPLGSAGMNFASNTPQLRNHMLYLLSSPTGPEALLFAPNHGYFTSQQTITTTQSIDRSQSQDIDAPDRSARPTSAQPVEQNRGPTRNNEQNQVALRPRTPAQGQAQAQPGRREGEDLIALILQRGWLFIRLYMFIFVLSEPATWRRYILLTIASLICLLPRNNPFTELFQAARRHFDNLIGPPQPPARPPQAQTNGRQDPPNQGTENAAAASNSNAGTSPPTGTAGTSQLPSPEEHARRLLREHEERHPNVIRNAVYRIEQAVALFLASLIPGVGERHVRAREEARRIVQEEERRRREQEDAVHPQTEENNEKSTSIPSASATASLIPSDGSDTVSTSIDTTSASSSSSSAPVADEGLRKRASDKIPPSTTST